MGGKQQTGDGPQIKTLLYQTIEHDVQTANDLVKTYNDKYGRRLRFTLHPSRENGEIPVSWKSKAIIEVNRDQIQQIENLAELQGAFEKKILNLSQFYKMYSIVKQYCTTGGESENSVTTEIETPKPKENDDDIDFEGECIICMERKPEIVLKCGHVFCELCLKEWNQRQGTCPYCRTNVKIEDEDNWILTSDPTDDIGEFLFKYLDEIN